MNWLDCIAASRTLTFNYWECIAGLSTDKMLFKGLCTHTHRRRNWTCLDDRVRSPKGP